MSIQPLVSVVIPAWNAEATLRDTLASVASQTYSELEIIIVDDGSTDSTGAIAEEFCEREARARLVRQANDGPASARNKGISEARGEWIALLDADDLWHPTKLEKQVAAVLAAPQRPGFVYCWYRVIDETGVIIGSGPHWAFDGPAFRPLVYLHYIRGGSSLLLSKQALQEVGGFDESYREGCEDVLLELEIARRFPILAVREYLFGYRALPTSFTSDFDRVVSGWNRVYGTIQGHDVPPKVIRWVKASTDFDVAERRALTGKRMEAAFPLVRALLMDPLRSWVRLAGRLSAALRPIKTTYAEPLRRHFYDVETVEPIEDSTDRSLVTSLLTALDARRLRHLAGGSHVID